MIERNGGQVVVVCDGCDERFNAESDDFQGVIEQAKQDGWRVRPDGDGGWEHHCSSCKGVSRLEAQRRLLTR